SYTDLLQNVQQKNVKEATFETSQVRGKLASDDRPFVTDLENEQVQANLVAEMQKSNFTKIDFKSSSGNTWVMILTWYGPFLLFIAFWIFLMRQMQSGGNKALSFGKSRAKLLSNQQKRVTFKDVAGVEEAKDELQEIIEFLKEPQKFQKLGGRIPK